MSLKNNMNVMLWLLRDEEKNIAIIVIQKSFDPCEKSMCCCYVYDRCLIVWKKRLLRVDIPRRLLTGILLNGLAPVSYINVFQCTYFGLKLYAEELIPIM